MRPARQRTGARMRESPAEDAAFTETMSGWSDGMLHARSEINAADDGEDEDNRVAVEQRRLQMMILILMTLSASFICPSTTLESRYRCLGAMEVRRYHHSSSILEASKPARLCFAFARAGMINCWCIADPHQHRFGSRLWCLSCHDEVSFWAPEAEHYLKPNWKTRVETGDRRQAYFGT